VTFSSPTVAIWSRDTRKPKAFGES